MVSPLVLVLIYKRFPNIRVIDDANHAMMQLEAMATNFQYDSEFLKNFLIPNYILRAEAEVESVPCAPNCPILVFVNSRSGGQLGGSLLSTYRSLLNEKQVFFGSQKF